MNSKVASHLKAKKFLEKILPISYWNVETAAFDIHKINNPGVAGNGYQNGPLKNFENLKKYILHRDDYSCVNCNAKKVRLNVHHIIFRKHNGRDTQDNLLTLCCKCHEALHAGEFGSPEKVSADLARKYFKKGPMASTRGATHVSTVSAALKRSFEFNETFGYETKFFRESLGLEKNHENDAVVIALGLFTNDDIVDIVDTNIVCRTQSVSKGDYAQTRGRNSGSKINTGKISGFRRFDKVDYRGAKAFIKGRMTSGYAILMDIDGKALKLKPIPKFSLMKRLSARKTWITILSVGENTS